MIIRVLREIILGPAYNKKLGISWHVHNMRSFSVFSTYLILTVFNRRALQLLIFRLSFVSPNLCLFYHISLLRSIEKDR